jgi:hypothetical protein
MLLPRLRSTKNSAGFSFGRDIAASDLGDGVASLEAVDEILYASTPWATTGRPNPVVDAL